MKTNSIYLRAAGGLLEALGLGMYVDRLAAIAEFVANCWDSDAERVEITIEPDRITIEDDGTGMTAKTLQENWASIGGKTKRKSGQNTAKGRPKLGVKGIGKFAGLGLANKMTIITTAEGQKNTIVLNRKDFKDERSLSDTPISLKTEKGRGHGTKVILSDIIVGVRNENLSATWVRKYLAREFPHVPDFKIIVNDIVCEVEDIAARRTIKVDEKLKNCGRITGKILIAKKRLDAPGVCTTVRGRQVGKGQFFGLDIGNRNHRQVPLFSFLTGSIEVKGFDDTSDEPIIRSDRSGFRTDHPFYVEYEAAMKEILKKILYEEEREQKKDEKRRVITKLKETFREAIHRWNKRATFGAFSQSSKSKLLGEAVPVEETEEREETESEGQRGPDKEPRTRGPNVNPSVPNINIGSKSFAIDFQPLGEAEMEVVMEGERIIVNSDHPTIMSIEKSENPMPLVIRVLADAIILSQVGTPMDALREIDKHMRMLLAE